VKAKYVKQTVRFWFSL